MLLRRWSEVDPGQRDRHHGCGGDQRLGESAHVDEPPRVRENPVLSSRSDGQEDGVDGLGRRAIGARLEPIARGAQELAVVAHAGSSPWSGLEGARLVECDAERTGGVVESRSGGAVRDAERLGDHHEGQAHVVVEDEHRPLVEREPAERLLQLVAVEKRLDVVDVVRPFEGQLADDGRPTPATRTLPRSRC